MKFKSKLSSVVMSLALLAVSFLSVASQKVEVYAASAEHAKTVETRFKDDSLSAKETKNDHKKDSVDVNSSDGVILSKEEYMQIKKFVATVSSLYKWQFLTPLAVIFFASASTFGMAVGLPVFGLINSSLACGIGLGGLLVMFVRSLEIAFNF